MNYRILVVAILIAAAIYWTIGMIVTARLIRHNRQSFVTQYGQFNERLAALVSLLWPGVVVLEIYKLSMRPLKSYWSKQYWSK